MAELQPQERMKAPFPAPPPFYRHFTKDNLARLKRWRKEAGVSTGPDATATDAEAGAKPDVDIQSLPRELRYLIPPPPPPANAPFKVFGAHRTLEVPTEKLEDRGVERLYPDHPAVRLNPQAHLISLARSQLATFLILIGNLANDPDMGWEAPIRDIETLTFNMAELVNQYRPHQARETLILMMEERVEKMRREVKAIEDAKRNMREVIKGLEGSNAEAGELDRDDRAGGDQLPKRRADASRMEQQRTAWRALESFDDEQE